MLTKGIRALDDEQQKRVLLAVQQFNSFTVDNDPWGERDCAPLTVDGINVIWKIDYYEDGSLTMGADDPMAPQTVRVLTVMLAEEY